MVAQQDRFSDITPAEGGKMREMVREHWNSMKPFRDYRRDFIRQFVGANYSGNGARDPVPVNDIELAVATFSRALVNRNPGVLITTDKDVLRPQAHKLSLAMTKRVNELNIKTALQGMVLDALFSVGIVKVGSELGKEVTVLGIPIQTSHPWVVQVDLNDYVIDTAAKRRSEISFEGNRFTVPLHQLAADKSYIKSEVDKLFEDYDQRYDDDGEEKTQALGVGGEGGSFKDRMFKSVALWEIWLPRHREVVTISDETSAVLRRVKWQGLEDGPYQVLGFQDVPGNLMPLSPIANIYDMHEARNELMRKNIRQALNQKTLFMHRNPKEGEQIRDANDLDTICTPDPQGSREVKSGGADPQTFVLATQLGQMISRHAGNIDLIAGLEANEETLGQTNVLASGSSLKMDAMHAMVQEVTANIVRHIAWYDAHNPLLSVPVTATFRGTDFTFPLDVTPAQDFGDFISFNFDIVAYSMFKAPPNVKAQKLTSIMQGVILPAMPVLAQQGVGVDFAKYLKILGQYEDLSELPELLTNLPKQPSDIAPDSEGPVKPSVTHRVNTRRNVKGTTAKGRDASLMNRMMGVGQQAGTGESSF